MPGQIITFTFPHIGNVGTNLDDGHRDVQPRREFGRSRLHSPRGGHRSVKLPGAGAHLDAWLKSPEYHCVSLAIDTRALTASDP